MVLDRFAGPAREAPRVTSCTDLETARRAVAEAERGLLAAAAARSERGLRSSDQSFRDEMLIFSPRQPRAPPLLLVGGMGPHVGLHHFAQACERFAGLREVVLVQACTVPDRSAAVWAELRGGAGADSARRRVVESLESAFVLAWRAAGEPAAADAITLCNTAHHFLPDVRLPPQIRPASLIEAAARHCPGNSKAIVLSTFGTRATGLYSRALHARNVRCLTPSAAVEVRLMDLIYLGVKAGKLDKARALFLPLLESLARWAPNADGLICGCTEIALLLARTPAIETPWPLIDPVASALADLESGTG